MTIALRTGFTVVSLAAMLALAGCAGAATDAPAPASEVPAAETTPEAAVVETACPDGFIAAYQAASIASLSADATFTEVAAADFEPQYLAKFLDGGCAVHVTGTASFNGTEIVVDDDYGFTTKDVAAEIIGVLKDEGFTDDGSGISFTKDNPFSFASVITPSDSMHTNGDAAVQQYYSGGTVFNAG